ncbi:MAG TPA: DUF1800 family protein [Alphaproteobacteria bacterium]|nr:DUF1800 family protein [Alphaproteobacteria bacterium]
MYHASQYDIRAMLRALFLSPFFRAPRAYYAKVKSPAEHVVGVMRLVGDYASRSPGSARSLWNAGPWARIS